GVAVHHPDHPGGDGRLRMEHLPGMASFRPGRTPSEKQVDHPEEPHRGPDEDPHHRAGRPQPPAEASPQPLAPPGRPCGHRHPPLTIIPFRKNASPNVPFRPFSSLVSPSKKKRLDASQR